MTNTDLTPRQKWVLEYLKGCNGQFISPSHIGNVYGKFVLHKTGLHSSTGSPILKELVSKGLVERNKKGHYKIKDNTTNQIKLTHPSPLFSKGMINVQL